VAIANVGIRGGAGGDMSAAVGLTATNQSPGDLNLTHAGWAVNKANISRITVSVSSGTSSGFVVSLYERDTFAVGTLIYTAPGINTTSDGVDDLVQDLTYQDLDATSEIHLRIVNTDGLGLPLFSVSIRGIKLV